MNISRPAILLEKFRNFALPAAFRKSNPTSKKAKIKKDPVPGPKNPS